ncbi:MAG: hypothetical protein OXG46_14235 [Chloroflexi bacterium]|nr:hypothetical protein [Chloroflexota bacterium]MCY3938996.1 hypothetical protein [Chloroflexota bacterium]
MVEHNCKTSVAIADCGVLHFHPARSELDLQRSLGITKTDDWGPFAGRAEDYEVDAHRGGVRLPRLLEHGTEA